MQYDSIPADMLRDFRRDMARIPWGEFVTLSTKDKDQIMTLIAYDFEQLMEQAEHMALRDAYLTTEDNEIRKQMLYDHYQKLLIRRGLD